MTDHSPSTSELKVQVQSVNPELSRCIAAAVNGEQKYKQRVLSLSQNDARIALDEIRKLAGSPSQNLKEIRALALQLTRKHHILPAKLFLQDVKCGKTEPSAGGGFADVFEGTLGDNLVALKRPRTTMTMTEAERKKLKKESYRESLMWKHLSHKHILPFLGVFDAVFSYDMICIILPWVSNGNIRVYIERFRKLPGAQFVTLVDNWLCEISQGLRYLDDEGIVHGDMHPASHLDLVPPSSLSAPNLAWPS